MFCKNCGKELSDDAKFCDVCGMMVEQTNADSFAGTNNQQTYNQQANNQQAYNQQAYVDAVPVKEKKILSKRNVILISVIAAAVIIICLLVTLIVVEVHDERTDNRNYRYGNDGFPYSYSYPNGSGSSDYGGYDGYDDYDDYGDYDDDYDDYGGYGRYYYGYDGSDSSGQSGSNDSNPLPTDKNGNSYTSPNYEWPSGDDKYEFYASSTIPKFESVTGKECTGTEVDDGNNYYKYTMDMDAYNSYISVLEEYGYSQSEFDVQGNNSYVKYSDGTQYLYIYLMNSDNEIVIFA